MHMTLDKKHILFVVAFILLVVSIVYRAMNPFEQARVKTLTYTVEKRLPARSDTLKKNQTSGHVLHDTVSRFIDPALVSATVHQDLFSIYHPPRPALAQEKTQTSTLDDIPVHDPEQERQSQIQDAIRDISGYRVFGVFEEDETHRFVFLSKGNQVIVAGKGDLLQEKYRIEEIEKTHINIMALHLNESIHLDMQGFYNE
jgi:regulatory protein YycI of two-component signal transduction system YycFG